MTDYISIKDFLGNYYSELLYSAAQDKYKDTGLDSFFEQRFHIQNNKIQMIVDPAIAGLEVVIFGNEIHISKNLFDHPNVVISNSLENRQIANPRSLYEPATFSTLAYLVCQNHTTLGIVGEIDEPIYIKYKSDYETFYNSVLVFDISPGIEVEIVEEIESLSALNTVSNYILSPSSKLNLSTFYQNHVSALSFCYRNIIAQENSIYNHVLFGKGSSNVIDENKIYAGEGSTSELLGLVNADGRDFHSVLYVDPAADTYSVDVDYKDVLHGNHNVTFFPVILGPIPDTASATIDVSNITLEEIPADEVDRELNYFISDIIGRSTLERTVGVERFYNNKSKFLHFL